MRPTRAAHVVRTGLHHLHPPVGFTDGKERGVRLTSRQKASQNEDLGRRLLPYLREGTRKLTAVSERDRLAGRPQCKAGHVPVPLALPTVWYVSCTVPYPCCPLPFVRSVPASFTTCYLPLGYPTVLRGPIITAFLFHWSQTRQAATQLFRS